MFQNKLHFSFVTSIEILGDKNWWNVISLIVKYNRDTEENCILFGLFSKV